MTKTGPKELWMADKTPIVYGLCLSDGVIRYVGMSKNPSHRFKAYRYPDRHAGNSALKTWLQENNGSVLYKVLHVGAENICEAEKKFISEMRETLFNIVSGGMQSWRTNDRKPWSAGRGVLCPSSFVLGRLSIVNKDVWAREKKALDLFFADMSDAERCAYEVSIAMDHMKHPAAKNRYSKWLDRCGIRMLECLAASNG